MNGFIVTLITSLIAVLICLGIYHLYLNQRILRPLMSKCDRVLGLEEDLCELQKTTCTTEKIQEFVSGYIPPPPSPDETQSSIFDMIGVANPFSFFSVVDMPSAERKGKEPVIVEEISEDTNEE